MQHEQMKCTNDQEDKAKTTEAPTSAAMDYTREQKNPIWTTGEKRNTSVRCACSQQPRGRERRFRNILQPVSSQWVSVRVEERGIDAVIVKRWRNGLGWPPPLHFFFSNSQFLEISSSCISCSRGITKILLYFRPFQAAVTHCENEIP